MPPFVRWLPHAATLLVLWADSAAASRLTERLCREYDTEAALAKSIREDLSAVREAADVAMGHGGGLLIALRNLLNTNAASDFANAALSSQEDDPTAHHQQVQMRIDDCAGSPNDSMCDTTVVKAHRASFVHCDLPHLMPTCEDLDSSYAWVRTACISVTLEADTRDRHDVGFCASIAVFRSAGEDGSGFDEADSELIEYVVMRPQGEVIHTRRGTKRISVDGFWYNGPVRVNRIYDFSEDGLVQYNQGHPCTLDPESQLDFVGRESGTNTQRLRRTLLEEASRPFQILQPLLDGR